MSAILWTENEERLIEMIRSLQKRIEYLEARVIVLSQTGDE